MPDTIGETVEGVSHGTGPGVLGQNDSPNDDAGVGVLGKSRAAGVVGDSDTWHGVFGTTRSTTGGIGVVGDANAGVAGVGRVWIGVYGETHGAENGPAGVWGEGLEGGAGVKGHARRPGAGGVEGFHLGDAGDGGPGVFGQSNLGTGVRGQGVAGVAGTGNTWIGVFGETNADPAVGAAGVWGDGKTTGDGVKGVATGAGKAAVCGFQLGDNGPGVFGQGNPAGQFVGRVVVDGDVEVTGDLILSGADYAEGFSAAQAGLEAGTVVVVNADGDVEPCRREYDSAVVGIVSGAAGLKPGVVLDRRPDGVNVAMTGKVWCLAEGPLAPGDLLTTSATPGHARRIDDRPRAFGALVGKALTRLGDGRGLVQVLVAGR